MNALLKARLLKIVRKPAALPAPRAGKWAALADPVDPLDTHARMRAQSLLSGLRYRDGSTNPDVLTLSQAQDVLRWATARIR